MDMNSTSGIPDRVKIWIALGLAAWLGLAGLDKLFQAGISYQNLRHWQNPRSTNDTVTVTGEGKVTAVPDVGVVSLSVESRGRTVADVQEGSTKKMNDIVAFLKGLDIGKKDIRTTQYSLNPNYTWNPQTGKQSLDGYTLSQSVEVKIRKLDRAGDVLGGALERGANQVGQLSFTIDEPEKLQAEAREKAIAQAREKAAALAKAAGVDLGRVRSFNENVNNPTPYPIMYARDMGLGEPKTAAPRIEAGSQEVVVQVSLAFEIE